VITVRYWAAARAAAGVGDEVVAGSRRLEETVRGMGAQHGEALTRVLTRCSFLLDGQQVPRAGNRVLPEDGVLDVLPPFAGG